MKLGLLAAVTWMVSPVLAGESGQRDDETAVSPLVRAVRLGQVEAVRGILAQKVAVDESGPSGWTPLIHALSVGNSEIAGLLLDAGADVKRADWYGRSVLWHACAAGDPELVRRLIRMGAPVDPRIPRNSKANDMKVFLSKGDAYPPAEAAIRREDAAVLEELLAAGLDPQRLSFDAMVWAARHGSPATIRSLRRRGLDPNGRGDPGTTPLIAAACRGNVENVKTLLELGADPNRTGPSLEYECFSGSFQGRTPLVTPLLGAVLDYRTDTAELLIRAGADVRYHSDLPIKFADRYGDDRMFALLRRAGAPAPGPYALGRPAFLAKEQKEAGDVASKVAGTPMSVERPAPVESPPPLPDGKEIRCAVVTGKGLDDFETVLIATLSAAKGIAMLERSALRQIGDERALARSGGMLIGENRKAGRLLGAEALIFLEKVLWDGKPFLQTTLVAAGTGVVLDRFMVPASRTEAEEWSEGVRRRLLSAGPKLLVPPTEAIYLSIAHFFSSGAYGSSRELARRMEILLRSRLGAHPRIFFLEREEMTRLVLEKSASGDAEDFKTSAWLLEGNLEVPIEEGAEDVSLTVNLRPARGEQSREVKLEGKRDSLMELSGECAGKLLAMLEQDGAGPWDREAEARAWGETARWNFRNGLLPAAIAAADAAEALGLDSDENRRVGIQARGVLLARSFQQRHGGSGVDFNFNSWAARDEPGAAPQFSLTPERMIGLALEMISNEKGFISCLRNTDARKLWQNMGGAFRDATLPLVLLQSLSVRTEHAREIDLLRSRIVALHDAVLRHASEAGDDMMVRQMLVFRCRLAPWWFEEAAAAELLRIYREEGQDKGERAEGLFAGVIYDAASAGYPFGLNPYPARYRMMWIELAQELAGSDHRGERFLAAAIQAKGGFSWRETCAAVHRAGQEFAPLASRMPETSWGNETFFATTNYHRIHSDLQRACTPNLLGDYYRANVDGAKRAGTRFNDLVMLPDESARHADLFAARLDWITFLLMHDPPAAPPDFYVSLPVLKLDQDDVEPIVAAIGRCREALASRYPEDAAKDECDDLARLAGKLAPDDPIRPDYFLSLGKYRTELLDGNFLAPPPISQDNLSGWASRDDLTFFDGRLWMWIGKSGEEARHYLEEFDPRSGQITLHAANCSTTHRPLLDDSFVVSMSQFADKIGFDVFDRKQKKWESREIMLNARQVRHRLVQGKLVVVFDEVDSSSSQKGRSQGILVHDIRTRETELLASTTRRPAKGPLDFPAGEKTFSEILHDGEGRVYFRNSAAGEPVVYNVGSGRWEVLKGEAFRKFKKRDLENEIVIDGMTFCLFDSLGDGGFLRAIAYHQGKSHWVRVAVKTDFSVNEETLRKYPAIYEKYLVDRTGSGLTVHVIPDGVYIRGRVGAFFVPMEEMREPLRRAHRAAVAANP